MLVDPSVSSRNGQSDGTVRHTGRVTVARRLETGVLVTLTLPDDWQTLLARVAALEAAVLPGGVPNSLEDLKYGG